MLQGNKARFINHACDPNCYSDIKQVSIIQGWRFQHGRRCELQQHSRMLPLHNIMAGSAQSAHLDRPSHTASPAAVWYLLASCFQVNGTNHICIFTKRAIVAGEELCYDYKVGRQAACTMPQCRHGSSSIVCCRLADML